MFTLFVRNSQGRWETKVFNLDDESIKTAVEYGKTFPFFYLRPDTYRAKLCLEKLGLI